jgi:hypothetical protein
MNWSASDIGVWLFLSCLPLALVGVPLMSAAFVMAAMRGGWNVAMQRNSAGREPLCSRLMRTGAFFGFLAALLVLLGMVLMLLDYRPGVAVALALAVLLELAVVWYFIARRKRKAL